MSQIETSSARITETAGVIAAGLQLVTDLLDPQTLAPFEDSIQAWRQTTAEFMAEYAPSSMLDTSRDLLAPTLDRLLPDGGPGLLDTIEGSYQAAPSVVSRSQHAWDQLTRITEALAAREEAAADLRIKSVAQDRAEALHRLFGQARDRALQTTYDEIRERFEELYRELHHHEESFRANLRPEGAGLDLEVDFHGRGLHPPHALHSEGHQDSMGVCVFLALSERLASGSIDLILLDDVMMSVDADHRRALARLLASAFPDRQLVITTHDRSWAGQLVTEGVVKNRASYHFADWHIETGPRVTEEGGLWSQIEQDLAADDVPAAAFRLRRGAEDFLSHASDALGAPVRYRLSGRVELGDLVSGAMSKLRKLHKQGKSAAQSWGNTVAVAQLSERGSIAGQVHQRTQAEHWSVNENVHYNNWANFTAEDFRPVVEAFQDLFDLFRCGHCHAQLRVLAAGSTETGVGCLCGETSWGLQTRASTPASQ